MKLFIPFFSILLFLSWMPCHGQTQTPYAFKVPLDRMMWHENIDKQQKRLVQDDGTVRVSADESINLQTADAIVRQVNEIQEQIEEDSTLSSQGKIKYLRCLDYMLQGYADNMNKRDFPPTIAPALVKAFGECL